MHMASLGPRRPRPSTGISPWGHRSTWPKGKPSQGCLSSLQCPGQVTTATVLERGEKAQRSATMASAPTCSCYKRMPAFHCHLLMAALEVL